MNSCSGIFGIWCFLRENHVELFQKCLFCSKIQFCESNTVLKSYCVHICVYTWPHDEQKMRNKTKRKTGKTKYKVVYEEALWGMSSERVNQGQQLLVSLLQLVCTVSCYCLSSQDRTLALLVDLGSSNSSLKPLQICSQISRTIQLALSAQQSIRENYCKISYLFACTVFILDI